MLGKLLKHEWKGTCKIGGAMLLLVLLITILGSVSFRLPVVSSLFTSQSISASGEFYAANSQEEISIVVGTLVWVMSLFAYIITSMGVVYGILIFLGARFYKTMYSGEGYLTHTLPVTANRLLASKILIAVLWIILIGVSIMVSVFALLYSVFTGMMSRVGGDFMTWYETLEGVKVTFGHLLEAMNVNAIHYWVSMIVMLVVGPLYLVVTMFFALTLGQLSRKYKLFVGILACVGLFMLGTVVTTMITFLVTLFGTVICDGTLPPDFTILIYDINIVVQIAMGALFYFLSHRIITRKLNLQ